MSQQTQLRIGLLGNTGVGKGTFVEFLTSRYPALKIERIKLADPLYHAQNFIYKLCNKDKDFYEQDGKLLNFLGQHMREINPNVLKDYFQEKLNNINHNVEIIICDDIRPLDVAFMRDFGFTIINIIANEDTMIERRRKRGDLTLANIKHKTEQGLTKEMYDYQIQNDSTIEEYYKRVNNLLNTIIK